MVDIPEQNVVGANNLTVFPGGYCVYVSGFILKLQLFVELAGFPAIARIPGF